ncbi:MAG: tRNA (adenosine(37)-N6)-threonylcarbamoyltransferase complex ATPase subunit type 1 TsaE [Phycisphaerae bacterium]|nr:tRNA (adenosine(37)-N6)-threonylcarbamoyltransferase complex ATPase subunit type 1 TsaE [Phycisphaerae bacterium]NIP52070.1 tRNA (adenosine(37)-N6)-threonylcarbamoyltransferase complex ATPase subunit type 1 TsaE [Phycisphaerae bacterium]NIS50035.1 tRNA (adenosine(37)-N6)-threonylcarbamoyltransferase complex ATPase subunit type 1 TsaE [Phycisphaerae bacterium]NIU10290.1 tRNA (adenosine(37)-N6)-threonylcarbamoyltransferase complex ATPase subunit type 1 TsaE [Phycisphaerae bacterium]NIU55301.1 
MGLDIISNSPQETIEFGRRIGSQLKGGEVIGICGLLGSGKTHLIKGIAAGAGAEDSKQVNSPTFVIVNEYAGRLDIYHIDAYRLNSVAEFEMLGFDEFCRPQSVVLIEWADKIESVLKAINYIRIEIFHAGRTTRKIHVENAPGYIDS